MTPVWLLLTAGTARGVAIPLSASIYTGVHGEAVRQVVVAGANASTNASTGAEVRHSAVLATGAAARLLYREGYLDRQIVVRYEAGDLGNVVGRSAELAFALALVAAAVERAMPAMAATGTLDDGGAIGAVEGVGEKLDAALAVLPKGGVFIFPAAALRMISPAQRHQAAGQGVTLLPAFRLDDLLARLGVPITRTWLADPFRGLEPFGYAHASIFFGRTAEVADLVALLSRRPAVLVSGPSGAGKSSLALAGVLPALIRREKGGEGLRWGLLRPRAFLDDGDPARVLAEAWCHDDEGGLSRTAAEGPLPAFSAPAFAEWLADWGAVRPVWVLDQLEDLFADRLSPELIAAIGGFLAEATRHGMRILATMTNAALPRLAEVPALDALFGIEGRYVLDARLGAAQIEAALRGPAAAADLRFEAGLDAEILASAGRGGSDVLPLMEVVLTELYERRDAANRELRWADYRAIGGFDGVIGSRAEAVFAALAEPERQALPRLFWSLATEGGIDAASLDAADPLSNLLEAFLSRRLLVRDGTMVRAAHDALLRHWQRAVDDLAAHRNEIDLWLDLHREARQWRRGQRSLISPGPLLEAARAVLARRATSAETRAYVAASLRQRDRRRLVIGGAAALSTLEAGLYGWSRLTQAIHDAHLVRIDFNAMARPRDGETGDVPGQIDESPADATLAAAGVTPEIVTPAGSRLVIGTIRRLAPRSVPYLSKARPETSSVSLPERLGWLTQTAPGKVDDLSFRLRFPAPMVSVRVLPASRAQAADMGVGQPQEWQMTPLDRDGRALEEDAFTAIYEEAGGDAAWHEVRAQGTRAFHGVEIASSYHNVAPVPAPGVIPPGETSDDEAGDDEIGVGILIARMELELA